MPKKSLAALLALCIAGCGGSDGYSGPPANPSPPPAFVSAPDCAGAGNIIAEAVAAPSDVTYLRVQHIGDPGTAELAGEVANPVTWAVGDYTGLHPADRASSQRGYRDLGPPEPASAFQLACGSAGFLINTWQFSHAAPLVGEGPSVTVGRSFASGPRIFRQPGAVLTIEASVNLQHVRYQGPHTADGTAQLSFLYYVQDTTTGTPIAHVMGLFDSRPLGSGSGVEFVGHDGQTAFIASPLRATDASGAPVRYARPGAGSATMRTVDAWSRPELFRAEVTYEAFAALLAQLRAGSLPAISPRPEDYRLNLFGVLGEVFPGTGSEHNVAIGASVTDLKLSGS